MWEDVTCGRTQRVGGRNVWEDVTCGRTQRVRGRNVWEDVMCGRTQRVGGRNVWETNHKLFFRANYILVNSVINIFSAKVLFSEPNFHDNIC